MYNIIYETSAVQVRCRIQDARGWCIGMTLRDGMRRKVGGWFRMWNTCTPVTDSCVCLRTWHLVSISSFLMLSKVAFNGSFRTLILIDHVIGGKEVFIECPLYIHHSTRDLSSGVCGCNPCDILHEVVKEHCPSKPPTIAGFISNSVTHDVCIST